MACTSVVDNDPRTRRSQDVAAKQLDISEAALSRSRADPIQTMRERLTISSALETR